MYQYPYGNAQQLNLDWIIRKLQELESGSGADLEEVANALVSASFDATIPYRKFDYAFYDGKLYRALNDTIGAFNPADWLEVTLGDDIPVLTRLVNADSALITTLQNMLQNLGSDDVANESTVTGTNVSDALGNLSGAITSDPSNRLKGKKVAIYGDSWATSTYGSLGASYIESITGETVHVVGLGSHTMRTLYNDGWDSYNADIYIIEAGLNDKSTGVGATDFSGAVNAWLTAIRGVNSSAEIYFVTPPSIRTNNQYQAKFPLEFYRIGIWQMSSWQRYHVINGLKWNNITFQSDNVHPTAASATQIGKYIVEALINYGDAETHDQEISNLGRNDNQLLFKCDNGEMFILTQNLVMEADAANYVNISLGTLDTIFGNSQQGVINGKTGSAGLMIYNNSNPNLLALYQHGLSQGSQYSLNGTFLKLTVNVWQMPTTF